MIEILSNSVTHMVLKTREYNHFLGRTILHEACVQGRLETVRFLVEEFPFLVNEVDNEKRPPLFDAIQVDFNATIMGILLAKNASYR